jgi:membrane associated rhomboid family serine protease
VPIGDDNPLKSIGFQYVTLALIVANVLAYLFELADGTSVQLITDLAVVPAELLRAGLIASEPSSVSDAFAVPERATLLSYMFLHADAMHLIGNMLFLWVFGDNVEDAMGHARFLMFYLICGVVAALFHAMMLPGSQDALIGASGAVAGVIGAYLMLHPRVGVWVLALKFIPLRISAALVLGFWIVLQFIMVLLPDMGPTAWWAHIGGFIAGALLIVVMRRPGVPLFDKA